jgi:kindlin 2
LLEAKVNFIKAWQSLPDYGVSLFVVRFHGEKKDELLGVAANKIMRMSLNAGDHIKTWRFSTMKAWNINWETKHMMIQFDDDKSVIFNCLSPDCKVVHEFIGGYIFLSMRSKDANQSLNEEMFHKLTGGWV